MRETSVVSNDSEKSTKVFTYIYMFLHSVLPLDTSITIERAKAGLLYKKTISFYKNISQKLEK